MYSYTPHLEELLITLEFRPFISTRPPAVSLLMSPFSSIVSGKWLKEYDQMD